MRLPVNKQKVAAKQRAATNSRLFRSACKLYLPSKSIENRSYVQGINIIRSIKYNHGRPEASQSKEETGRPLSRPAPHIIVESFLLQQHRWKVVLPSRSRRLLDWLSNPVRSRFFVGQQSFRQNHRQPHRPFVSVYTVL